MLGSFLPYWLFLGVPTALGVWYTWESAPWASWFCIGVFAGTLFRDVGRFIALTQSWPVLQDVIRFERVRELLESDGQEVVG
jgi:hypothetical protein